MGTTSSGVVDLAATVMTPAADFFFDFPVACLVAAVNLDSSSFSPAVFLVAWSMCISTSYTRIRF